jgi:hypothetical protein
MTPERLENPKAVCSVGVTRDQSGSANFPTSKWRSGLAKLPVRWGSSLLSVLLWELGRGLPRRIRAIARNPELRFGYHLPLSIGDRNEAILYPPSKFLLACNVDIQRLKNFLGAGFST